MNIINHRTQAPQVPSGLKTIEGQEKPLLWDTWLSHQRSLTAKLRNEAGDAQLQVLQQQWTHPDWWARYVLNLQPSSLMLQREIVMRANEHVCWYAKTLIPDETYHTHKSLFARLKHQSLGELIFNEPQIKRASFINYVIDAHCLEYYWLEDALREDAEYLWARISMFTIDEDNPFYLIEILLPGLLRAGR